MPKKNNPENVDSVDSIEKAASQKKSKSILREYVEAFVIAVGLALLIRTFVVQAFKIPSGSMLQTLQIGDHILVNKFIYRFDKPERGDILVFKYPEDPSRDFIKRAIGLPGDTLEISEKIVYINGKQLIETYAYFERELDERQYIAPRDSFEKLYIPPRKYFMMGDNRDSSMDSRYWGLLKEDMIKGKAFIIYWSIEPYEFTLGEIITDHPGRIFDYIISLKDRIRWERIGKILH